MSATQFLPVKVLKGLWRHPEYGGGLVGDLDRDRLLAMGPNDKLYLDSLAMEIDEIGIYEPLEVFIASNGEAFLNNGHHRAVVAMELRLETVPVVFKREDDEE